MFRIILMVLIIIMVAVVVELDIPSEVVMVEKVEAVVVMLKQHLLVVLVVDLLEMLDNLEEDGLVDQMVQVRWLVEVV